MKYKICSFSRSLIKRVAVDENILQYCYNLIDELRRFSCFV